MKVQDLRSMLDRMPGIRHAGDVDLLKPEPDAAPAARQRRRAPITKVA
jgi:hypothetical protein